MNQETTLVLTIKHSTPLPANALKLAEGERIGRATLSYIAEQAVYNWLAARGIRSDVAVSVEVTEGV